MSRKAVIHIGLEKTGSTSLQKAMYSSKDALLSDLRILYPSLSSNLSIHLATLFWNKPPLGLQLMRRNESKKPSLSEVKEDFRLQLEHEFKAESWDTLILSAENLRKHPDQSVARLLDWIGSYVDEICVVAFVRHPVDWTRSMVQQVLQSGRTFDFIYAELPELQWRKSFTPWINRLGLDNFRLVPFEQVKGDSTLLEMFCMAADLPHEKIERFVEVEHTNESMSHEAALLMDSLNRQRPLFIDGKVSSRRIWKGANVIKQIAGSKFRLTPEVASEAREKSRVELEWLNGTFGVDYYADIFLDTPFEADKEAVSMSQETVDTLALTLSDLGNNVVRLNTQKNVQRQRANRLRAQIDRNLSKKKRGALDPIDKSPPVA